MRLPARSLRGKKVGIPVRMLVVGMACMTISGTARPVLY